MTARDELMCGEPAEINSASEQESAKNLGVGETTWAKNK